MPERNKGTRLELQAFEPIYHNFRSSSLMNRLRLFIFGIKTEISGAKSGYLRDQTRS